jgi:hypothetical protein
MVTMQGNVQTNSLTLRRMAVERFTATGLDLRAATVAALRRSPPWSSTPNSDATAVANWVPAATLRRPPVRARSRPKPPPGEKDHISLAMQPQCLVYQHSKSIRGTIRTTRPNVA